LLENLAWYVPFTIIVVNAVFWTFWVHNLHRSFSQRGNPHTKKIVIASGIVLLGWLWLQGTLAFRGFYLHNETRPEVFLLAIGPPLLLIFLSLVVHPLRDVLSAFSLRSLTYIHTLRFFVELVVYVLYLHGSTPKLLTFFGRNPDILIGFTAPIMGYFCFTKHTISRKVGLIWHVIGLLFLMNVSTWFMLTIPSPFQLDNLDYSNTGFFYFPFIWAPAHGVPTVILAHCIAIRLLWRENVTN
jgi:hypothetical protein